MARLIAKRIEEGHSPDKTECSGRCHRCDIRFIWARKLGKLSELICPFCFEHLKPTTHLFKGETMYLEEAH